MESTTAPANAAEPNMITTAHEYKLKKNYKPRLKPPMSGFALRVRDEVFHKIVIDLNVAENLSPAIS